MGGLAYLFLLPANRSPAALTDAAAMASAGQPAWLSGLDRDLASALSGHGTAVAVALAVLCDLVALSIFASRRVARAGIVVAVGIAAFIWMVEGFGAVFSGRATDPNSGIVLALAAAAFWPLTQPTAIPAAPRQATTHSKRQLAVGRRPASRRPGRLVPTVILLGALSLLATGAVAASFTDPTSTRAGMSMSSGMSMPGMSMPAGMSMCPTPPRPAAASSSAAGPSTSARMVCGVETRHNVATAVALAALPAATATWVDHLYTCTYRLPAGRLILSVKELPDVPVARAYFDRLGQQSAPTDTIVGLASLGLPGYQTAGAAVFLKDDKVLQVDATGLPGRVGPDQTRRAAFAYQIATDVLGCWTGK